MKISTVCDYLDSVAPISLAEDWDNVGLILGDASAEVVRMMTCLTITPESAAEAIEQKANLIVSHHPLPFTATKRITTDRTPTKLIWQLAQAGVSVYSPHTAFDSATSGINQMLCDQLEIHLAEPIVPNLNSPDMPGAGRIGKLAAPLSLGKLAESVKRTFSLPRIQVVGALDQDVVRIATACGSGGSFLSKAARKGADCLVTGEATFHTVLEARASDVGLVLMGHYFSERFAIEVLAEKIRKQFPDITVWSSNDEADPIHSL